MKKITLLVAAVTLSLATFAQAPLSTYKADMNKVFMKYLDVENALAAGNTSLAKTLADSLLVAANAVKTGGMPFNLTGEFSRNMVLITANSNLMQNNTRLESQLKQFELMTQGLYPLMKDLKVSDEPVYYNYCSAANNYSGGHWLTNTTDLKNPFMMGQTTGCEKLIEKF